MHHYVISDLHLGHKNVIKYSPCRAEAVAKYLNCSPQRIIESLDMNDSARFIIDIHNKLLVQAWNSVVNIDDIVYFLGDFALTRSVADLSKWCGSLNGRKHIILGNHDTRPSSAYVTDIGFESASRCPILFNKHIFLSHEPLDHELVPTGCYNFFGHVHTETEWNWERGQCVCVEQLDSFKPLCIDKYINNGWFERKGHSKK